MYIIGDSFKFVECVLHPNPDMILEKNGRPLLRVINDWSQEFTHIVFLNIFLRIPLTYLELT